MKQNKKIGAFLGKAKNVLRELGSSLANNIVGKNKSVINLDGIADMSVEQRLALARMLDIDSMFRAKKYDILVRLGQIEEFVERGLENELIARYPAYKEELGSEIYEQVIELVGEETLKTYINDDEAKSFKFFLIHPLGLKVLVKNQFYGFIAANEKAFRELAVDYPKEFGKYFSKEKYVKLLKKALD